MQPVLLVTGEYPPRQGGVGAYTAELAKALLAENVPVSVLTTQEAADTSDDDVPVLRTIAKWDWRIWPAISTMAAMSGFEWIHVQYQTAAYGMHPAVNFAPWWWRRQKFKVAWTYHDLLIPYLFPKVGARMRRWVTEWPGLHSDLTIVTNEADRQKLEGRAPYLASVPIGSNIQATILSDRERRLRRKQRGYDEDTLLVGYFGFLNRSKGGLTLVQALHYLVQNGRDAHLLMIGERVGASDPTNHAYLHEVEAEIARLGLIDRVQWTGRQPDVEVSADLAICDVLLMPYEDGASLRRGTLMAGIAHGCAIVTTTPSSPLPQLLDGRDLLYVAPSDARAAAKAVMCIADDPSMAESMRRCARERSHLFDWETIAQRHVALYSRAAQHADSG